jgi:hypothetical protein
MLLSLSWCATGPTRGALFCLPAILAAEVACLNTSEQRAHSPLATPPGDYTWRIMPRKDWALRLEGSWTSLSYLDVDLLFTRQVLGWPEGRRMSKIASSSGGRRGRGGGGKLAGGVSASRDEEEEWLENEST